METQPAAPDHIQAIFTEMENRTTKDSQPWHDAMLALEDLNSILKGKKVHRDTKNILSALKVAMGEENMNILLEWVGVTITEGKPTLMETNNLQKLEQFLHEETIQFSNAHPIGGDQEQAA